jgi:hypothetical protein
MHGRRGGFADEYAQAVDAVEHEEPIELGLPVAHVD